MARKHRVFFQFYSRLTPVEVKLLPVPPVVTFNSIVD